MERLRLEPGKLRQKCYLLDFTGNTRWEMSFKMAFIDNIFSKSVETFFIPGKFLTSRAYLNLWCLVLVFSLKFLFTGS